MSRHVRSVLCFGRYEPLTPPDTCPKVLVDRDKYGPMLLELAPQIAGCVFKTPETLDAFMHECERRLARLSDENMVLKAEQFAAVWPVRRLECMRECIARKREVEALAKSLDHSAPAWGVKSNVRDELQHVIDR